MYLSATAPLAALALVTAGIMSLCVIIIIIYALGYKRVPPGKAMVVYGKGFQPPGYVIIIAGGKFILPVVQGYNYIPIEKWNCEVPIEGLASNSDPDKRIDLKIYCQFGIGDDEKNMKKAVTNFLKKSDDEVHHEIEEMVKAHTSAVSRDLFGKLPLRQLTGDWAATSENVRKRVEGKVGFMGVTVPTMMIRDMKVRDIS